MATLDSPLDLLPFDYLSFGALAVFNNFWTWIAVVTAAVSFWRIRATTSSTGGGSSSPTKLGNVSDLIKEAINEPKSQAKAVIVPVTKTKTVHTEDWSPFLCDDGVTKGKVTAYYGERNDDGYGYSDGELTDVKYDEEVVVGECGEWWERWERVVKMRNGVDSWYRYMDLTVMNGNVVRLWDVNGVRYGEEIYGKN